MIHIDFFFPYWIKKIKCMHDYLSMLVSKYHESQFEEKWSAKGIN